MKTILAGILLIGFYSSCYYDKEEILYPNGNVCDTTLVTYSQTIAPIISASCLSCHGGGNASAGIRLDNYNGVKNVAGTSTNSLMFRAITHVAGVSPMPKNGTKLSDCNIDKIRIWIAGGALNN